MIKKMMASVTNSKDILISSGASQAKGEGSAAKGIFGSLLQSVQKKGLPEGEHSAKGKPVEGAIGKGESNAEGTDTQQENAGGAAQILLADNSNKAVLPVANKAGILAGREGSEVDAAKKPSAKTVQVKNKELVIPVKAAATGEMKGEANGPEKKTKSIEFNLVKPGNAEEGSGKKILQKSETKLPEMISQTKAEQAVGPVGPSPAADSGKSDLPGAADKLLNRLAPAENNGKVEPVKVEGQQSGESTSISSGSLLEKPASPEAVSKEVSEREAKFPDKGTGSAKKVQSVTEMPASKNRQAGEENRPTSPKQKGAANEWVQKQQKAHNNILVKGNDPGLPEKEMLIKNILEEQARKEDQKRLPSFVSLERDSRSSRAFSLGLNSRSDYSPVPGFQQAGSGSGGESGSQAGDKMLWDYVDSSIEMEDGNEIEKQGRMKLGQVPVSNISLRRKILPALTQKVYTAAAQAKEGPKVWQKHNFVLDDGKEIQLSARQGNSGVLHLKLGSLQGDLNRLLQQHQQQIREHLEQECGTEIDLQLDNGEGQQSNQYSGDPSSFMQGRSAHDMHRNRQPADNQTAAAKADQVLMKTVRKFGYNRTEWTA